MTGAGRAAGVAGMLLVAVLAQTVLLRTVSAGGVVPDLVLVLVVLAGIARGPRAGAVLGFAGGLLLDLAPPADHLAGRWALALVLVGCLAGLVRDDVRSSPLGSAAVAAAGSFVGTSVFALSGLLLGDGVLPVEEMVRVILTGVILDAVAAAILAVPVLWLLDRLLGPWPGSSPGSSSGPSLGRYDTRTRRRGLGAGV